MNHNPLSYQELLLICGALAEGEASREDIARLDAALSSDPKIRAMYIEYQSTAGLIGDWVQAQRAADATQATSSKDAGDELTSVEPSSADSTHTGMLALMAELEPSDDEIELVDLTQTLRDRELAKQKRRAAAQRRNHPASEDEHRTRVIIIPKLVSVLGLAAAIALLVTGITAFLPDKTVNNTPAIVEEKPREPSQPQAPAPVVATLVRSLDARWLDDPRSWDGADGLREGKHHLTGGLVEIELTKGARVVLEAPISFTLNHTNAMTLTHGRLVATVPPAAVGFTVKTPSAQIIDYGTEFGVDVMANGVTQAHVFTGEITAAALQGTAPPSRLLQGEASAVSPQGQVESLDSQPLTFVREQEFTARYHAEESAYHRWLAYRYELLRDPGVVIYYAFEEADLSRGVLPNAAQGDSASEQDARLVLGRSAPGRFPDKPAAGFIGNTDHVAATLDREMEAVTLAGWFWIDEMHENFASLLHTSGTSNRGGIHWHLNTNHDDGWAIEFVQFRMRTPNPGYWYDLLSNGWQPQSLSGRWVHLALCYDSIAGIAAMYVDGQEVARSQLDDSVPIKLGDFRLGSWYAPMVERSKDWPRPLRGRIDEFVVIQRRLTGAEVAAMYDAGRPDN